MRFRSGSRDDPATRSRPPMDAPKGKNPPFAIFAGPRAGCSRDSATVQAEKERSRAKPDRSSLRVSPIPRRPEGLAARSSASLGVMFKRSNASHPPRKRIYATKGGYSWMLSSLIVEVGPVSPGAVMRPRAVA